MTTPCRLDFSSLLHHCPFLKSQPAVLTLRRKRVPPPFGSPTTLCRTRGIAKLGKYAGQPEGWSIVQANPSLPRRRSKSLRHVAQALNISELCLPMPVGIDMPMDNANAAAQKRQGMPNGCLETSVCQSLQSNYRLAEATGVQDSITEKSISVSLSCRRIRDQKLHLKVPL